MGLCAYKERYTKQSCSFWPRLQQSLVGWGFVPDPHLVSLQRSPRPPSSWFREWGRPGKGNEGGEGEGRREGGEGRRKEGKGKGKGEYWMRGEAGHLQIFRWIDIFG